MKRRGFTLVELIVIIVIIGIVATILFPVFHRPHRGDGKRRYCQSNLKRVGLGILQYSQDYDEKLPRVAVHSASSSTAPFKTPYGWADAIHPYLISTQLYQCPSQESSDKGTNGVRAGFTDYWMNANLSGIASKNIKNPTSTLLSGDGNDGKDGTDARYNRNSLPLDWSKDETSPARRHLDTANYLFADGHVKALPPNSIQNNRTKDDQISFAVK